MLDIRLNMKVVVSDADKNGFTEVRTKASLNKTKLKKIILGKKEGNQ